MILSGHTASCSTLPDDNYWNNIVLLVPKASKFLTIVQFSERLVLRGPVVSRRNGKFRAKRVAKPKAAKTKQEVGAPDKPPCKFRKNSLLCLKNCGDDLSAFSGQPVAARPRDHDRPSPGIIKRNISIWKD